MNEFQEKYKSLDNYKLLKIIEEAANYRPKAVEAANLELSKRKISNEEIQAVKKEILSNKVKIANRKHQFKKIENKVKGVGKEVIETISPIQKEPQTINRKINWIVIMYGFLAVHQVFTEFEMMKFMLTNSLSEWDLSTVLYIFPIVLLPIGVLLFGLRKKIGWILMCAYLTYNLVNTIWMFLLTFNLPQSSITLVLIIAILGTILWVMNREDIKNVFSIDNTTAMATIVIVTFLTSLLQLII